MTNNLLVLQTDFGFSDGAVASVKGQCLITNPGVQLFDLTHEIPPFNIKIASWTLNQSVPYWPQETTFISVVDPGVGGSRNSVVAKTKTGHWIVSPNNGTLTYLLKNYGFSEIYEIHAPKFMRENVGSSNTFHGRDLYSKVGAQLAGELISASEVGPKLSEKDLVTFEVREPKFIDGTIFASSEKLDFHFGGIWTNISEKFFNESFQPKFGDWFQVKIHSQGHQVYSDQIVFQKTFVEVDEGEPLLFVNSLYGISIGVNLNFFLAQTLSEANQDITLEITKV